MNELPSQKLLKTLFDYNRETGVLTHKFRDREYFKTYRSFKTWNARFAGTEAGSKDNKGYIETRLFSKSYFVHRLAWKIVHGVDPLHIDHIDHNTSNNRLENLRSVTALENSRNASLPKNSTTKVVGVSLYKKTGKYHSQIRVHGELVHLGFYDTIEQAAAARTAANIKHGFHENHGAAL